MLPFKFVANCFVCLFVSGAVLEMVATQNVRIMKPS